jgi:hypothetical protein
LKAILVPARAAEMPCEGDGAAVGDRVAIGAEVPGVEALGDDGSTVPLHEATVNVETARNIARDRGHLGLTSVGRKDARPHDKRRVRNLHGGARVPVLSAEPGPPHRTDPRNPPNLQHAQTMYPFAPWVLPGLRDRQI